MLHVAIAGVMAMLDNRDPRRAPSSGLLHGRVQHYAWGSRDIIAGLQGRPSPTAQPEAELWFGAHPTAPAWLERPGSAGGVPLDRAIAEDPAGMLGEPVLAAFGARLPFLVKVLAVGEPLSLQAHPSAEQARAGFHAEETAGIPRDAATRRFPDDWPKPEVLHALTPVTALCGFRDVDATLALLDELDVLPAVRARLRRDGARALRDVVGDLLTLPQHRRAPLVAEIQAAVRHAVGEGGGAVRDDAAVADGSDVTGVQHHAWRGGMPRTSSTAGWHGVESVRTAAELAGWIDRIATRYPQDPGVAVALLLDLVRIAPGSALGVPTGRLHAYLEGAGVEIMAASDNVLRGGLTAKHVDVAGLLEVLDATAGERLAVEPRTMPPPQTPARSGEASAAGAQAAGAQVAAAQAAGARDSAPHLPSASLIRETVFPMATARFQLSRFELSGGVRNPTVQAEVELPLPRRGPEVLLCTQGTVALVVDDQRLVIGPGQAVFVAARASEVLLQSATPEGRPLGPAWDRYAGLDTVPASGPDAGQARGGVPDPERAVESVVFRATVGDPVAD